LQFNCVSEPAREVVLEDKDMPDDLLSFFDCVVSSISDEWIGDECFDYTGIAKISI
jgi:hypothetical protein